MIVREIGYYLENLLQGELLAENLKYTSMKEDGLHFGSEDMEVTGILVCWMATADAIKAAAEVGCSVIICHEDPFFRSFDTSPETPTDWPINKERMRLLAEHGMAVYRCHSPLDVLHTVDAALDALNLDIQELRSAWIARVAIVDPMTVGELAERVRQGFGYSAVKIAGDSGRTVSSVGISVGGMGLSLNIFFQERLREMGAEAIVTGEFDDYSTFWAKESDVVMIAATHPANENLGLMRFRDRLAGDYPDIPVFFYECSIRV